MIDLCHETSSLDAKTAFVRGGLADSKHTISMKEADQIIEREYLPVKFSHRSGDISGQKHGRWSVLSVRGSVLQKSGSLATFYTCKCDCGNIRIIKGSMLVIGHSKSCGCLRREIAKRIHTTHGMEKSPEYMVWWAMKNRCSNPKNKDYKYYGGRGISVCDRWKHYFENFFSDMGIRPTPLHTIDRIETNGNYEPNNCRWATPTQQARNKSNNIVLVVGGISKCLAEWCEISGKNRETVLGRLKRGWSHNNAIMLPVRKRRA